MKRRILLLTVVIVHVAILHACDICGCGVGNNYIGILPEFHKQIFGIRYRYNSLVTHVGVGGSSSYLTTHEHYQSLEAWAGFNIGKKVRLLASIPYNFDEKLNQGNRYYKNGVGDISATGFYELINTRKSINHTILINTLWLGGGIKLPTGKYNPVDKGADNNNLFQLGTGSIDLSLNGMYDLRFQDAGLNINTSYKINNENSYQYKYGNKFTASSQVYYKLKVGNAVTISPNAGVIFEDGKQDRDNKTLVDISGGRLLMSAAGLEASLGKIALGCSWQSPLSQNIANGIIRAEDRLMIHVSVML